MDDTVEIADAELLRETDKAGLFKIGDEEHWLPWSQIEADDVKNAGDVGTIYVPQWLVDAKEIDC